MRELNMTCTPVFARAMKAHDSGRFNVYVFEGGSRCFSADTEVVTKDGRKRIADIVRGDVVLSIGKKGEKEWKAVKGLFVHAADKPMVRVHLKNGEDIVCSYDHKFLYHGEYKPIIEILKLCSNK